MSEGKEIQKRMKKSLERKEQAKEKAFIANMLLGKVGVAARFINNEDAIKGCRILTLILVFLFLILVMFIDVMIKILCNSREFFP